MMKNLILLSLLLLSLIFPGCKEEETNVVTGFATDKAILTEGASKNNQVISVTLTGALSSTIKVPYQIKEGTAKAGLDVTTAEGELEFSKGKLSTDLTIEILGDTYLELGESFDIIFTYNSNAFSATIEIANDDVVETILTAEDGFYTPETYPSMQVAFRDEFDGASLNTTKWTYELGNGCSVGICGWGNNELETYTNATENIKLDNGKLVITALKNIDAFTSARIKTQDKVELKFGRIDVRAKLPKGQGIWPAIWMLGENIDIVGSGWPICGEIDIMEVVGHKPTELVGTVHYNNDGYKYSSGSTSLSVGEGDFSDKFHVFSIVWDKNKISWYLDNKVFKEFSNTDIAGYPFNKAFFFIMNIAVGGNWPGSPDATTVFPQTMVVDYIRVFQ
jgi:beta-glucanase (GH16 family)